MPLIRSTMISVTWSRRKIIEGTEASFLIDHISASHVLTNHGAPVFTEDTSATSDGAAANFYSYDDLPLSTFPASGIHMGVDTIAAPGAPSSKTDFCAVDGTTCGLLITGRGSASTMIYRAQSAGLSAARRRYSRETG